MSNRIKKANAPSKASAWEMVARAMEYVLAAAMCAMCVAVSFYAEDGYYQIGNAKFAAYRVVMITGFIPFLILAVLYAIDFFRKKRPLRLSVTDGCAAAYLLFVTVAVVSGGFYEDALWGSFGWNMGWMSQFSFVLIYFAVSRFGRHYRAILGAFCGSAFVVFLIGILHRMMIDPIGFYEGLSGENMAQFLSTMGQATWYASYLVVALPVGVAAFLFAEKKLWRALGGVFMAVGFASLVTQNSDSAYFAFVGFMLVFFLLCVESRELIGRFAETCTLFFAAGKVMSFLLRIRPNPDLEYDFVTRFMLEGRSTWVILGLCIVWDIYLYTRRNRPYSTAHLRVIRRSALIVTAAGVLGMAGVIVLQTKGVFTGKLGEMLGAVSYFNWNDAWGNGRGRIWNFAVSVFARESLLHKLFGVGPDCFGSYALAVHGEEVRLLWGDKVLTNAHSEWVTTLVNTGIFGAAAYIGIFVTAVRSALRAWRQEYLLAGVAAAVVSYMAYNFFCYQQVCCTPFVFLLLGTGEYIRRERRFTS
ncbi:MAG: O-antigen ligase family protein [Bacteroidales bacterium]|nr:O-antigen ligase family protein [Bacteroidales bacterium]MCM1415809.1 O-antigen ligase family protein [bacterium]MCM1422697.1 O-antigen ligase family protein [bacterium]